MKRIVPTGGVIVPIDKLKQSKIPKWIASIPSDLQIGKRIGVNISIAGVTSINVPTTSNNTFIRSNIRNLLVVRPSIALAIISGIPVNAIAHDIIDERPIMNVIIPVVLAASRTILGMSLILNALYISDNTVAYTTAIAEPSVAVKIPPRIPPITITISKRLGIACQNVLRATPENTWNIPCHKKCCYRNTACNA